MYRQEKKAGFGQYLLCVFGAILLWVICDFIGAAIKNSFASDILFVVAACVAVYLIYAHYCAVFIYEINEKKLILSKKIGHREIKEEIPFSKINKILFKKPIEGLPKKLQKLTVGVLSKKNFCYCIYEKKNKCIIFEPDNELVKKLKEKING